MPYDPPSKENWCRTDRFAECYAEAYDAGYKAARDGKPERDNPHQRTNHERDSGHSDDMHYYWWCGWNDYEGHDPPLPPEVKHEQLSPLRLHEDEPLSP